VNNFIIIALSIFLILLIPASNAHAQSPDQLVKDGWELAQQMQFKEAIDLFEAALEAEPQNPRILEALAKAYNWDKQYSASISYYETLLELEPENVDAMVEAARVYSTIAYYEDAIQWLTKAHELAPKRDDIAAELATEQEWVDRIDNRIISLQRRLALDYGEVGGYISLGRTYLWTGELENAKATYEDGLKASPNNPQLLYNLGLTYEELGDWSKARDYYQRAVDLKPDYIEAKVAQKDLRYQYHPRMTTRYHINRYARYDDWLGFTGSIERNDSVMVQYIQPILPSVELRGGYEFSIERELSRINDERQYMLYLHNPFLQASIKLPYDIGIEASYSYYVYTNGMTSLYELAQTTSRNGGYFILSKYIWHNNLSAEFNRSFFTEYSTGVVTVQKQDNYTLSDDITAGRYFSCLLAFNLNRNSTLNGWNRDYTLRPRLRMPFFEPISITYMFNYAGNPTRYTQEGILSYEQEIRTWLQFELAAQVEYYSLVKKAQYTGLFSIKLTPLKWLYLTGDGRFGYFDKDLINDYVISATVTF